MAVQQEPREFPQDKAFGGVLENDFYRPTVNAETGKITGFYDKEWMRELIDPKAIYSPGTFIYERLGKNRGQLEQRKLDEFTRKTWQDLRVSDLRRGPVWESITANCKL